MIVIHGNGLNIQLKCKCDHIEKEKNPAFLYCLDKRIHPEMISVYLYSYKINHNEEESISGEKTSLYFEMINRYNNLTFIATLIM